MASRPPPLQIAAALAPPNYRSPPSLANQATPESLALRIATALLHLSEEGTPPASPFADVVLQWASPLADAALKAQFLPERLCDAADEGRRAGWWGGLGLGGGGGGGSSSGSDGRYVSVAKLDSGESARSGGVAPTGHLLPPHATVLRVTPSMYYAIPGWRYQSSSFSFFVWARLSKFYLATQRAVLLSDWAAPSCLLFAVTAARRLSLTLHAPAPPLYAARGAGTGASPGRYGTTGSMPAGIETELLLEVMSAPGVPIDDQWAHVGFSYHLPTGEARLYVNGQSVAEKRAAGPTRSLPFHLRPQLFLGYCDADKPGTRDGGCHGYLSDARFYRGAVRLDELLH
jgi:hypothetical protein